MKLTDKQKVEAFDKMVMMMADGFSFGGCFQSIADETTIFAEHTEVPESRVELDSDDFDDFDEAVGSLVDQFLDKLKSEGRYE